MNICVFIAGPEHLMSDQYEVQFCKDSYSERFGEDTDGVFLYIDMTGKKPAYDYMATAGKAILFYQDNVDDILDLCVGVVAQLRHRNVTGLLAAQINLNLSCADRRNDAGYLISCI